MNLLKDVSLLSKLQDNLINILYLFNEMSAGYPNIINPTIQKQI
jgi:hypothetical protein